MTWKLFIKELKSIVRDKGIILLLIGGPVFYSFFYPFPYSADIVREVPVAVIDMDKTANSRALIRMIDGAEELKVLPSYTTPQDAYQALSARKVYGIIYIEKDFQKNVLKNIPQKVKIYTDGSYMIYYKQVTGAAQRVIKTMSAGVEIKKLQSKGAGKAAYVLRSPVNLVTKNLFNPLGGYTGYIVPGVFIAIIHQVMIMAIGMRAGTLRETRKKYMPCVRPWEILLSKVMAFGVFALFYFFYFFIIMYNVWGFTGGYNVFVFFLFYAVFAAAAILAGIFVSGFFKDREGALVFVIVTSLPIMFMSGIIWPVYLMPFFIRVLRTLFPMTYGVNGVVKLFVMDAPLSAAGWELAALCALAVVYGVLAYRVIKKRYPYKI